MPDDDRERYLTTGRLEALTDGVFAIAMTLLVLGLHIPVPGEKESLASLLLAMWPVFLTYFATFMNLGIYWVGQNNQFHYIRYTDRIFLWLHLIFLLFVTLLPFSTAVLGTYPGNQLAEFFYGGNLVLTAIMSYLEWWYATRHHRLVRHETTDDLVERVKRRILFAPVVCILAMLLSFVSGWLGLLLYLFQPTRLTCRLQVGNTVYTAFKDSKLTTRNTNMGPQLSLTTTTSNGTNVCRTFYINKLALEQNS